MYEQLLEWVPVDDWLLGFWVAKGPRYARPRKLGRATRPASGEGLGESPHWRTPHPDGMIDGVTSTASDEQRLRDLRLLRRVRDRMDREFAQPLDVEALARGVGMSGGHLSRQFRLAYGESPYSYLMTRRIEREMSLLRMGELSVTEVCFAVGCSSLGTFSTRFTELVGMSPSAYQRQSVPADGIPSCVIKKVTRPIRIREARGSAALVQ